MKLFDWRKGALCLTAVAALCCALAGNALAEEDPWSAVRSSLSFEANAADEDSFGKEAVVYFLARFVRDAKANGSQKEIDKYSQQISENPKNWEAYISRSFARFATLWDDLEIRYFAKNCGLDIDDPVLHVGKEPPRMEPDGTMVRDDMTLASLQTEIELNQYMDKVCGAALPIIQSAIYDLDKIPEEWSDTVKITPQNTGYGFDWYKTYNLDCADVQMIKAIFYELMSFLELVRGYSPYSAGSGSDGINRAALAASRDYYLKAVERLMAFTVAYKRRTRLLDHLFMLAPFQVTEIEDYEQAFFELPWWTTEVRLTFFAQNCFNRERDKPVSIFRSKEWQEWKKAESDRKKNVLRGKQFYMSLRSLFEGEVSRAKGTLPLIVRNHVMVDKKWGMTDPTCGGLFPELDRKFFGELVEIFDSDLYDYDKNDTAVKYHAVVYELPKSAENDLENPAVYTTDQCPIVLKEPTFDDHVFTGWLRDFAMIDGVIPAGSEEPLKFTATFAPKWGVGATSNDTVVALKNGTALLIDGKGAMKDFTAADPAPWANEGISLVTVGPDITSLGAAAFAERPTGEGAEIVFKNPAAVIRLAAFMDEGGTKTNAPAVKVETAGKDGQVSRVVPSGFRDVDTRRVYPTLQAAIDAGASAVTPKICSGLVIIIK